MDAQTATSLLASMFAQAAPAPIIGDQPNLNAMQAPAPDAVAASPNPAPVSSSTLPMSNDANNNLYNLGNINMAGLNNDTNNLANMAGMFNSNGMNNNMNVAAQAQAPAGGLNPNDLNLMNAVLMNNTLQQQAQGGMNPLVLQTMMNQGMLANPMGTNNLLQQGMMNPMLGGMGMGGFNAMGGNVQGGFDNSANNNANNAPAPGVDNNATFPAAPAASNAPAPMDNNNGNDMLLAQLLQNPMSAQLLSQGINPMVLLQLQGMNNLGGMGQNPLVQANPLTALGLGMNGLGAGLAVPNDVASAGLGTTAPHPNALFAFNNPAMSQVIGLPQAPNADNGALKQASKPGGKKHGKKSKVKGKPKRPLSAYNFFFRAERSRILDSIPSNAKKEEEGEVKKEPCNDEDGHSANENEKDYDQVGADGKKIPHGKIGFESLAKRIGKRWQNLGPEDMETYKKLADEDMTRYKKEMEVFLTKEAAAGMAGDGELGFHSMLGKRGAEEGAHPKKKRSKKSKAGDAAEVKGATTVP